MKIKILVVDTNFPVNIRQAVPNKHLPQNALKCLPLMMACQYGYELLINEGFTITWNGGPNNSDTKVVWDDSHVQHRNIYINGGNGFFSILSNVILRTPIGVNTYITGPLNHFSAGIQPMTAIVETDWNIVRFAMNFKLMKPNRSVKFNAGEPYCRFFPIERKYEEKFTVSIERLADDKKEFDTYIKWQNAINEGKDTRSGKYRDGLYPHGDECPISDHQKKLLIPDINRIE